MVAPLIAAGAAALPSIVQGIAGIFGGDKGKTEYPITSSKMDYEAALMQAFANMMMAGKSGTYGGYKGKGFYQEFALPPPLQQAYNQIKAMVSYQVPQEIDAATKMSQLQGTQLGEALAERGIGPGGQRSALEADIYGNLMENILGARRAGAMETAKLGAELWGKSYETATDWMKTLATGGGGGIAFPSNIGANIGSIAQGAGDFANSLYRALSGGVGTPQPWQYQPAAPQTPYNPNVFNFLGDTSSLFK